METEALIRRLATGAGVAPPLARPSLRAARWLTVMGACAALAATWMAMQQPLTAGAWDVRFLVEQIAAIALGSTAALAAFSTTIPGTSRRVAWWPIVPCAVWLSALVVGSLRDARTLGWAPLAQSDWPCIVGIVATGALPAVVMFRMLGRGAPIVPRLTSFLAAVAIVSLASATMCVSVPHASSAIVLLWHGGAIAGFALLGGLLGRRVLRWPRLTPTY
jgi:hypothetical protein